MHIRNALESERDELIALWRLAFPDDSLDHVGWFFANRFTPERCLALLSKNRIASCLYLLPYRVKLRGVEYDSPFVVGAATHPLERGKGHMGALLRYAYEDLRERGNAVSMLYPFRYGFYRRLGFETVSAQLVYTLDQPTLAQLLCIPSDPALRAESLDGSSLFEAYGGMMERFDMGMVRNLSLCHERIDEWSSDHLPSLLCKRGERAEGYALYAVTKEGIAVSELVYRDISSLLFLLGELGKEVDRRNAAPLTFPMPVDEPIDHLLEDARECAQYNPFAMLRVVDVQRLLGNLPLRESKPFLLRVNDPLCPWNDGVFDITPSAHTAVSRASTQRSDAQCTINTLAQLASGFLGGREAHALGLLTGDEAVGVAFERTKNLSFDLY